MRYEPGTLTAVLKEYEEARQAYDKAMTEEYIKKEVIQYSEHNLSIKTRALETARQRHNLG